MDNTDDMRVADIMNSELEAYEVLGQLDDALEQLEKYERTFPVQTMQSMSERWGISKQAVVMRHLRDPLFPKPLTGIIEVTKGVSQVFAIKDVETYERAKGLTKKE